MLTAPFWPEALAQFSLTSLEKSSKRELALEPDLGVPLGPLDIDRYSVMEEGLPLAPEDAALLEAGHLSCFKLSASFQPAFQYP